MWIGALSPRRLVASWRGFRRLRASDGPSRSGARCAPVLPPCGRTSVAAALVIVRGYGRRLPGYPPVRTLRKYSYSPCTFVILTNTNSALPWRLVHPRRPLGDVSSPAPGRGASLFDNL